MMGPNVALAVEEWDSVSESVRNRLQKVFSNFGLCSSQFNIFSAMSYLKIK